MKFKVDHDLHIHSNISLCSLGEDQTPERILDYAKKNTFHTICLTDHYWDETVDGASPWYQEQNFEHICKAKPLPQDENVRYLFGCETDLRHDMVLGITKEHFDLFDFVIIPITHMHMRGFTVTDEDLATFESRANAWVRRFDRLLSMDIPFHKTGIAHLTCGFIAPEKGQYLEVIKRIPESTMQKLFTEAAEVGMGIELNAHAVHFTDDEAELSLLPYRIAKDCGCKFYCGSDSHTVDQFSFVKTRLERAADFLGLTEEDKFIIS